jgi:hypothetical protein
MQGGVMKTLTTVQAIAWVSTTGLSAGIKRDNDVQSPDKTFDFTVPLPKILPYQVPFYANSLLPRSREVDLEPFLFWITDNGASGEFGFSLGCRTIELLRIAHGEHRPILETPAYLFDPAEAVDACVLATMALLFSWSAYMVPLHGRYFIYIDDDEVTNVFCRNKEDYDYLKDKLQRMLKAWGTSIRL